MVSQGLIDQAWQEGKDAYHRDESDLANPYSLGSVEHESWSDGYEDAEEDEKLTEE